MKIKYLILALLPFSLMACQTVQNVADHVSTEVNMAAAKNSLIIAGLIKHLQPQNHWY